MCALSFVIVGLNCLERYPYKVYVVSSNLSTPNHQKPSFIDGGFCLYGKGDFRKIIENELKKNEDIKNYFDNWGSRCYTFSNELVANQSFNYYTKNLKKEIYDLDLNTEQLKEMNREYVLSAVKINNFSKNDLIFAKLYINEITAWDIYLYKVNHTLNL